MDDWSNCTLGDVLELKRGYDLPHRDRREGQYPIVSSSGVSGTHKAFKADAPGVVTGRYGTIGEVYFIEKPFWPLNTSLYVRDFKGNDPRFISYFLRTIDYYAYSDKAAVPGVNRNHLHLASVVVPPIEEQRAIASVLGSLDDKIELNRRMNRTLEQMAAAIFKAWFVDFEPVRAKASGAASFPGMPQPVFDALPATFADSELGPIPEGWEASRLGNAIEIHDSKRIPLSRKQREERQGTFPYYGATGIFDYVDDYLFDGKFVLIGEDGSVIQEDGTPFSQYIWGKIWVNNHAHVLTGKEHWTTELIYLLLRDLYIAPFVTGAVQAKLNQGNMKAIPVVLPSGDALEACQEQIGPLFDLIRSTTDEIQTLAETRDALLPKLLSGTVRLREQEK
tara:strand:+ start:6676 stop:7854 length:1179 start_codon:yes stop_codon:yes gene_type:complete